MEWFRNLKVGHKLLISFSILLVLTTLLTVFSIDRMEKVNRVSTEISRESLPAVQTVLILVSHLQQFRMEELQHLLAINDDEISKRDVRLMKLKGLIDDDIRTYEALITSQEIRSKFSEFIPLWRQYLLEHEKIVSLSRQNMSEEAKGLIRGDSSALHKKIDMVMAELVKINVETGRVKSEAVTKMYEASKLLLCALLALFLLLGAALSLYINRLIVNPLRDAAILSRRVADADLTITLTSPSNDEIGELLQALTSMTKSLRSIVQNVRSASEAILFSAGEMAEESADLAQRMNQQASILQRASRSMHDLSLSIQRDADEAANANRLIISTATDAVSAATVVTDVIHTMHRIQSASNQIGDITSTIEGIAFQTNILAINASVEAARAAEHGRGFAVVAEAVRALSQRSTAASSEIKDLVENSVDQAKTGTSLADRAGVAMSKIQQGLGPATAVIANISDASIHHAKGIEQLSQEVSNLDRSNNSDLALVDRTAQCALQLQEQARALSSAVSIFKI